MMSINFRPYATVSFTYWWANEPAILTEEAATSSKDLASIEKKVKHLEQLNAVLRDTIDI